LVLAEKNGGGLPSAIIKVELKFKAMGGFPAHGLFYFCLFFGRLGPKKAMDANHSLFCFRLLKNAHLRRCPHSSSLRRTPKYASLLRILGALHLGIFDQPLRNDFLVNF
jgi:hypothetical protein